MNKNLSFGEAIEAVKDGKLICRSGWNGKRMFVFMRPACTVPMSAALGFESLSKSVKEWLGENMQEDENLTFNEYLCLKAADGTIVNGWTASQTDILSTDWMVLE